MVQARGASGFRALLSHPLPLGTHRVTLQVYSGADVAEKDIEKNKNFHFLEKRSERLFEMIWTASTDVVYVQEPDFLCGMGKYLDVR